MSRDFEAETDVKYPGLNGNLALAEKKMLWSLEIPFKTGFTVFTHR